MYNIDNIDIQILNLLKMDARTPLDELASQTGLTTSVISERLTNLENSGYIKGYHADIDLEKIGYKIKAFVLMSVLPDDQRRFYDFIQKKDCILECSHITGQFSMLLKVIFPTTSELDTFIGELQEFGKTETRVVFSTVLERF